MDSQDKVAEAPIAESSVDQLQSRAGMGAALPRPRLRSEHLESADQVRIAALAAADRKAEELVVLEVAKCCDFTDHFLICSGSNERQVQAIADAIQEALHREGIKPLHVEGLPNARWVLLDFGGDFVAHVFVESARRFYDLERLWSDAPDITARLLAASTKA
jgi:ribosome-associated protein